MALKAIFFDLDDTLMMTTATQRQRAERVAARLGQHLSGFDAEAFVAAAMTINPETGWVTGPLRGIEALGLSDTELGREALELWFFNGCFDLACCFEGGADVIRRLAERYVLGVITNGREDRQRAKFEALGLQDVFRVFVTSERAGVEKPHPRIFELALAEAGVEASEALFVGDRLDVDVLGARQAGMSAVWLDHGVQAAADFHVQANVTIREFRELAAALEALAQAEPVAM